MGGVSRFFRRNGKIPIVGQPDKHVRVFMPSYPGPRIQSVNALVEMVHQYQALGMGNISMRLSGGAYLNTLQNIAMADMIDDENAIGLLFVEHDAVWPTAGERVADDGSRRPPFNALQRLISRDKDIIGGLCTNRTLPVKLMAGWYLDNGDLRGVDDPAVGNPHNGAPFEVDWIATHFLYVSRHAAIKTAEHVGSHLALFDCGSKLTAREDCKVKLHRLMDSVRETPDGPGRDMESFCTELESLIDLAGYYQNDISFCRRAKAAGCQIWVDPSFEVQHIGDYSYSRQDWIGQKMLEQERAAEVVAAP